MLKSGYKYKYSAVNQERLFNNLCLKYHIFNVKKYSKTKGEFCITLSHAKKFEKNKNENIQIEQKTGFGIFYVLSQFLKRYGILTAVFVCTVFLAVNCNFVFQIKIDGLHNIKNEKVIHILKQNGLNGLVLKKQIDCAKLEKCILEQIDEVSLVSIIIKGNSLVVSIKEKVKNDEYENIDGFSSLKSQFEGVITEVKLIQGTSNIKVGDVVRIGDELVWPYIIDSSGERRAVEAKAEIYATVYIKNQQSFYEMELVTQKTGRMSKSTNISVFGLNIYQNIKECEFEQYETETNTSLISKNNILPIYKTTTIYYETQTVEQFNDYEQKKVEILTNLKQKTLEKIEECDIIENERQNIISVAGKHTVEYVLEVNKRIC